MQFDPHCIVSPVRLVTSRTQPKTSAGLCRREAAALPTEPCEIMRCEQLGDQAADLMVDEGGLRARAGLAVNFHCRLIADYLSTLTLSSFCI